MREAHAVAALKPMFLGGATMTLHGKEVFVFETRRRLSIRKGKTMHRFTTTRAVPPKDTSHIVLDAEIVEKRATACS